MRVKLTTNSIALSVSVWIRNLTRNGSRFLRFSMPAMTWLTFPSPIWLLSALLSCLYRSCLTLSHLTLSLYSGCFPSTLSVQSRPKHRLSISLHGCCLAHCSFTSFPCRDIDSSIHSLLCCHCILCWLSCPRWLPISFHAKFTLTLTTGPMLLRRCCKPADSQR